ncbi:hypothetical protein JK358_02865 [Nocardia sp. 2]|uniref:Lipoprotein n=1 Tax=Nocardia acididurans TaxID=2802282 RepID=A0ABS1LYL2_9NOCA|nr:hypothetical protein [Nocardia acididurans]MBL1073331.1 hypothetical protein [Nocardia acididurans]
MEYGRTALRGHDRGGLLGRLAVAAALLLTGCDAAVGIPGDAPEQAAAPAPSAAPGAPEPSVAAIGRWAADLRAGSLDELENRCWTMAPGNVRDMYDTPGPILEAIDEPGVRSGSVFVWRSAAVTVVARDRDVAAGYACPHVFASGDEIAFNAADARHTVRRFLARAVGAPLDSADVESSYPLVCAAERSWDPDENGKSVVPPMAAGARTMTGIRSFTDESIKSEWPYDEYITVSVPVTTASGVRKKQTFTLKSGSDGYCIGDVSG